MAVPTGGLVNILLGNGDGSFQSPMNTGLGTSATYVESGDFNMDGRVDLIATGSSNTYLLAGNGNGTFQSPKSIGGPGIALRAADLNNDGKLDLLILSGQSFQVLLGNGDGTFQPPKTFGQGTTYSEMVLKDFNGDGKLDVAAMNNGGNVSVFAGKGDGSFEPRVTYIVGAPGSHLANGDVNNDGAVDLVVSRPAPYSDLVLVLNRRGISSAMASSPNPSTANQPVTLTATMSASVRGSGTPTGTVMFKEGTTILGTAALNNGKANLTVSFKAGTHKIKPIYSGDTNFNTFTGQALTQTVNP